MKGVPWKYLLVFLSGMLALAIVYILFTIFGGFGRPQPPGIVEEYGSICFWYSDQGSMQVAVTPYGCYSPTCTRPVSQTGSAVVFQDQYQIQIDTVFNLVETNRFPLPCVESCSGGGQVVFDLGALQVGEYQVFHQGEAVGSLNVFSGLPTPRQCFEKPSG
jgi:hypothetical protein